MTGNLERYTQAAVAHACERVAAAGPGSHARNATLAREAFGLGRLVGGRAPLRAEDAEAALVVAAAPNCDRLFPASEARYTARRGIARGQARPQDLAHVGRATGHPARLPRPGRPTPARAPATAPAVAVEPPPRPPADEVRRVWESAVRVDCDDQVRGWLDSRAIDPAVVADRNLARVLLPDAPLPKWAGRGRHSWAQSGHRVVVPWYDAEGAFISLHARFPGAPPDDGKKGLAPRGASTIGCVMADALGRTLLRDGPPPWFDPAAATAVHGAALVIAEGVPDYLTLATLVSDAGLETAPAVWGFTSGGPTADLADRVPAGWSVAVDAHADESGDRYLTKWNDLFGRRCRVLRLRAGREA